jgi:acetyl/propionyl-CoA carboxylase alpha subunit
MNRFVNGDEMELSASEFLVQGKGPLWEVFSGGVRYSCATVRVGDALLVSYRGRQFKIEKKSSRRSAGSSVSSGEVRAPMPGAIVDLRCKLGDVVVKGAVLLVLEAMKTHQQLLAPIDGTITKLLVQVGTQVADGQVLVVVGVDGTE